MFLTVTLISGAVGVLVGLLLSRRGHPRGAAILAIAAIVCLISGALRFVWPGGADEPVKVNEAAHLAIATQRLGDYLATHHAGASAIVILPFEWRTSPEHRGAMSSGLLRGLAGRITVVKTIDPPLPAAVREAYQSHYNSSDVELEVPDMATWFTAAFFEKLVGANVDGAEPPTIIISLAGLPQDSANIRLLKGPKRVWLATAFGPVHALHRLIESGDVIAAADHHPAPDHREASAAGDITAAFDRRYLLITPENLKHLQGKYPALR